MTTVDRVRNFFNSSRKGENFELRAELNHEERWKRKEAVKKVIANMTIGKDVSNLFADVVKNMQTEDLEMKKLIYLYLMNYAKTQPELVILAINTFLKDSEDFNPLIRALAIRTMGCLRVEKILDYLLEPLKKALKDEHPYVRKTAALAVPKIFDLAPSLCVDNGLISALHDMLSDSNPIVISNSVAALTDIAQTAQRRDVFTINSSLLHKLLLALNDCTEWGQICILDCLADYEPATTAEACTIVEKVLPRFQHVNASVVMAATKVMLVLLPKTQNSELEATALRKMSPALITLLSSEAEIQYTVLRNLSLMIQTQPNLLGKELRVFFCKFNDPPCVKFEKLDMMLRLVDRDNVDQLLSELKEYSNEVDMEFVRRTVRAVGQCAVKVDSAAERAVNLLLELIRSKVDYVVQEAIIVIKDIFRKYPQQYESIIPLLCENIETLDDPEARASLVWILGEYSNKIDNAQQLLGVFVDRFLQEDPMVQLQLLSAVVKLSLKKPNVEPKMPLELLKLATDCCDNPDVRDKAFLYYRLLTKQQTAQLVANVVMPPRPPIQYENNAVSEELLIELTKSLGSIASVFHRHPALIGSKSAGLDIPDDLLRKEYGADDDVGYGEGAPPPANAAAAVASVAKEANLLDLDFD